MNVRAELMMPPYSSRVDKTNLSGPAEQSSKESLIKIYKLPDGANIGLPRNSISAKILDKSLKPGNTDNIIFESQINKILTRSGLNLTGMELRTASMRVIDDLNAKLNMLKGIKKWKYHSLNTMKERLDLKHNLSYKLTNNNVYPPTREKEREKIIHPERVVSILGREYVSKSPETVELLENVKKGYYIEDFRQKLSQSGGEYQRKAAEQKIIATDTGLRRIGISIFVSDIPDGTGKHPILFRDLEAGNK